jgi:DNA-binding MurR/RpiR family transcriptional regulator
MSHSLLSASLVDRIRSQVDDLTDGQREVARFVADNPGEVVFLGVRELAGRVGVSTATVLRLARSLGYTGYAGLLADLQEQLLARAHPSARLVATLEEIRQAVRSDADLLAHALAQDGHSLTETLHLTRPDEFARAVTLLDQARLVYACGEGLSAAPVETLAFRLRRLNIPVITATGAGAALFNVVLPFGPEDVLVAIGSQPVPNDLVRVAAFARRRGGSVVALTDTQVSPLHGHATVALHAKRGPLTHLTSVVAPVALANALAVALAWRRQQAAEQAYADLEALSAER